MGKIDRLLQLSRTVRYLKPIQIIYQVKNRLSGPGNLRSYTSDNFVAYPLQFSEYPERAVELTDSSTFTFLNLTKTFKPEIDWNFMEYGKLWNYNLQYFNFLHQPGLSDDYKLELLRDIYAKLDAGKLVLEPYPVSLRSMNVIRFLSGRINAEKNYGDICKFLFAELTYLHSHYEFHILGNHLLENAFCMMMGSCFFEQKEWRTRAQKLMTNQLSEQILSDGAHFERSPMYHQIILFRVLEAAEYFEPRSDKLRELFVSTAQKMLSWLREITFTNGDIPHMNDSSPGIAFTTKQLLEFAKNSGIEVQVNNFNLGESGYRKLANENAELVFDVEGIEPEYQPGHAHADHLSFVLYVRSKPFIVDPGISTYNIGARRQWERSSIAHNSVTVDGENVSEVWGGFRVGRRPNVSILEDHSHSVQARVVYNTNSGRRQQIRRINLQENKYLITDTINAKSAEARFHFHPDILITNSGETWVCSNGAKLIFDHFTSVNIEDYQFNEGYNLMRTAKVIVITFDDYCTSEITIDQ